jgi:hypothetical protein
MRRIRRPGAIAATRATAILDALSIRDPEDLDVAMIAAHLGVFGVVRALDREEGHLLRAGDVAIASVAAATTATLRWRWVLAHELGHKVCDRTTDDFARCTSSGLLAHPGAETRANDFAGELLMPARLFEPRWRAATPSLAHAAALADTFGVSFVAAALRGLQYTETPSAVVCSKDGAVTWCAASVSGFPVKLAKGDRVPDATALLGTGLVEETTAYVEGDGVIALWRRG